MHFFLNPIRKLSRAGHEVTVASRRKDVTLALLDSNHIEHTPISAAGSGTGGLAQELLQRDSALIRLASRFRADVLTGFGGVAAAHAAFALRKRSVVFYDTNTATLQNRLCFPFATEVHVPEWYAGTVPESKTFRFRGLKESSYLHPSYFSPERERAIAAGLDPNRDNFFVRVVGWGASHDVGKTGWTDSLLTQIVRFLEPLGRPHISSERELPAELTPFAYAGDPADAHHLLGHCRMLLGESITMAAEACVLGIPSVFAAPFALSNAHELKRRGLLEFIEKADSLGIESSVRKLLSIPREAWLLRHRAFLNDTIDVAEYVSQTLTT